MEYNDLFDISELIAQYLKGKLSPVEEKRLDNWLAASEENRMLFDRLTTEVKLQTDYSRYGQSDKEAAWSKIVDATSYNGRTNKRIPPIYKRIVAAAVLLIATFLSTVIVLQYHKSGNRLNTMIKPGSNKAILTLANGRQILLDKNCNVQLAQQGKTILKNTTNGELTYQAASDSKALYNTLSTPRGGQYHLVLTDGTNVWLNAASSITYPTAFTGKDRQVRITGEVYFEVAHNKNKPFKVHSDLQNIEVLGTHFNVNAYLDEPNVKTTLLEGKVSVEANAVRTTIMPGEQSILVNNRIKVEKVDTDDVVAWKNGIFQFSDESLETIMRKLSRWYNVDIEYENTDVKALPFTGIITHFSNISKVLRMLELTKRVHFKIAGQKIIVTR